MADHRRQLLDQIVIQREQILGLGIAGGPDTDAPSPAPAPDWAALRTGMRSFRTGLRRLAQVAREQLPATLGYATHDPAAGLLLAFVQLFQDVQREQLNRFPERHLDFYYGEILQMRPRPATADQMHLVCRANPRTSGVRVAAGTPFDAGTDLDAKALTYLLDDELIVGPAEVTALRSLRLQCDPLVWPESRLGFVTALDTATLPLPPTGDDAAIDPRLPPHWPLLGGEASHRGPGQPQAAALGLAIASPMLQLSQGERRLRITLRLTYADLTDAQAAALIQQYARAPANGEALLRQLFLRKLQ